MTVCTWNVRAETENSKYWYVRTSHTCKYTSTSTCLSLQDFMWKQYSCRLCAQFFTFTFLTGSLCPGCPWECCFNGCRANFAGWVTLTGSTFSMPGEPCSEREYSERVGATTKSFKEIKQSMVSRLHKYSYQNLHHLFLQQKIFKMNKAFITSFKQRYMTSVEKINTNALSRRWLVGLCIHGSRPFWNFLHGLGHPFLSLTLDSVHELLKNFLWEFNKLKSLFFNTKSITVDLQTIQKELMK